MKEFTKLSLYALVLGAGFAGSSLFASAAKPAPDAGLDESALSLVGKNVAGAAGDTLTDLAGTGKRTGAKALGDTIKAGTGLAAAAASPIPPLNLNLDITTQINNCLNGDDITRINGENNTVQNVRGNCTQSIGATGDVKRFTLANKQAITVGREFKDFTLMADVQYNFTFVNGQSAALATLIGAPIKVLNGREYRRVIIYTTRTPSGGRWTERFNFVVEGDPSQGIAAARVLSDGNVEFFIFDNSGNSMTGLRLNILNKRTDV